MKKLGLGLFLCFTIFFGGCTNMSMEDVMGKLNNTLAEFTRNDFTTNEQVYFMDFPATEGYYATHLKFMKKCNGSGVGDCSLTGQIETKGRHRVEVRVYYEIYSSAGRLLKQMHNSGVYGPGKARVSLWKRYNTGNGVDFAVPKKTVVVSLYSNGKLLGTNRKDLVRGNSLCIYRTQQRHSKKVSKKSNSKKVVKQQRQTRQIRKATSLKMAEPQQRQQRQQRRQSL